MPLVAAFYYLLALSISELMVSDDKERGKRPAKVCVKLLNIAEARRKLEIELLWRRTVIFWGFTVVGFVAYAYCLEHRYLGYDAALIVAIFGAITSLIWALVNRGSKFWQEYWEEQIKTVKTKAREWHGDRQNYEFFDKSDDYEKRMGLKRMKFKTYLERLKLWDGIRFSPSRLITALSDFVFLSWSLITGMTLLRIVGFSSKFVLFVGALGAVLFTIMFVRHVLINARGKDRN